MSILDVEFVTDQESAGGQGWFWFEVYNGNTFGEGVGVGICVGCHGDGQDFFLTPFPLR